MSERSEKAIKVLRSGLRNPVIAYDMADVLESEIQLRDNIITPCSGVRTQ